MSSNFRGVAFCALAGASALQAPGVQAGKVSVVYAFCSQQNCTDGSNPKAGLTDIGGKLYGTTEMGGTFNYGTFFSIDPDSGKEIVLHSLAGIDGEYPSARLLNVNGTLFGTATKGGTYGYGVVFSLDPASGAETVLHSFNYN